MGGLRINPVTGRKEFHDGLDIACPEGTDVVAARDGSVMAAGYSSSYGNYVKLTYDDGYVALYAHLSKITTRAGEGVRQGQTVAYSGNTGRSTGPHLHYGLFRNGQYVNPIDYIRLPMDGDLYKTAAQTTAAPRPRA
jgi:murein DD-endopeptidase MepM/ murein hydrolase activator NlpD